MMERVNNIQRYVFRRIAKTRGGATRKQVQLFIWVAQGNLHRDFVYRQGYYSINIARWEADELLFKDGRGAKFKVTADGRKYMEDPKSITVINLKRKIKQLEGKIKRLTREERASMIMDQQIDRINTITNNNH